ncbi:transglycosylase [Anopheles sinensis]|uniref:Transglycosylase n=1 Tax=Anopheles sinensis TaxID=74873 RepID=A0A084WHH1_ANOSI|nr:transglycosylase [Anopheles sinensis]
MWPQKSPTSTSSPRARESAEGDDRIETGLAKNVCFFTRRLFSVSFQRFAKWKKKATKNLATTRRYRPSEKVARKATVRDEFAPRRAVFSSAFVFAFCAVNFLLFGASVCPLFCRRRRPRRTDAHTNQILHPTSPSLH